MGSGVGAMPASMIQKKGAQEKGVDDTEGGWCPGVKAGTDNVESNRGLAWLQIGRPSSALFSTPTRNIAAPLSKQGCFVDD